MTRDEQVARIEKERREREDALLLILLLLSRRARRRVNSAIRNGTDWRQVLAAVLLGSEALDQPGGVDMLALVMADSHATAVRRVGRLVGVQAEASQTREELVRRYEPNASQQLERLRRLLEQAIDAALADPATVAADKISADVIAAGGAFRDAGFVEENPYGAEREATTAVTIAYASGTGEGYGNGAVQAVMTGLRFVTVKDDRRTKICEAREGVTLPLDHPWWFSGQYPPLHENCRSIVLPLTGAGVKFTENPPTYPPAKPGWGHWAGFLSAPQMA